MCRHGADDETNDKCAVMAQTTKADDKKTTSVP